VIPVSLCNDYCHPGYQKRKNEGKKFCCYDCVPCPKGKISKEMADEKINTVIICGETLTIAWIINIVFTFDPRHEQSSLGKVWIMTAQVVYLLTGMQRRFNPQIMDGAIFFTIHSKDIPGFKEFLKFIKPPWVQEDNFFPLFWEQVFESSLSSHTLTLPDSETCTGNERMKDIPGALFELELSGHSYSIYNAVYVLAQALDAVSLFQSNHKHFLRHKLSEYEDSQPWQ
ncbi:Vomeronasal type-2 receptor 26, partial [Ophiophagus hannah]